jgi:NAD(P)-dependent dehydrogenase (short-subunit alcohol dehydrogenase family)
VRLTDSLAESVREHGVSVFAISPGFVLTAMTQRAAENRPRSAPSFPPEAGAALVLDLASGRADALTGRYFHVRDDLDAILRDAERVAGEDLLTLRFRPWNSAE